MGARSFKRQRKVQAFDVCPHASRLAACAAARGGSLVQVEAGQHGRARLRTHRRRAHSRLDEL
eukprot:1844822-Pleurochrysis_carterae.AAC.2